MFTIQKSVIKINDGTAVVVLDDKGSPALYVPINSTRSEDQARQLARQFASGPLMQKQVQFLIDAWEDYVQSGAKSMVQFFVDKAKQAFKNSNDGQ